MAKHFRIYASLVCLLLFQVVYSQQLSSEAQISVLTIGPGPNLNDAFGHNLFRITDPKQHLDITYDYGRFPFHEPGFYLNFARGKLNYAIGSSPYAQVIAFYRSQNRSVDEQVLNLTDQQKETLFAFLQNNYKPQNRNYLYDFFYDNCATKIRDVVAISLSDGLQFQEPSGYEPKTFRTLIQDNLNANSWGSMGIDIALGSVIDQHATLEEHMFLPEYIHSLFATALKTDSNQNLVSQQQRVYTPTAPITAAGSFWTSPYMVLGCIALGILFLTYRDYKKQHRNIWLDTLIFSITGLIGLLLTLLWFATDHTATAQNYNLLWAFPLNLILVGSLRRDPPKAWVIKYLKFLIILLVLMAFHWTVGIQVFAPALIPLLIALAMRYIYVVYYLKKSL